MNISREGEDYVTKEKRYSLGNGSLFRALCDMQPF
jgi:hypothetical protein